MNAVVIGAGLGGLAAAVRLAARGHRVVVHEATDQAGGRARVLLAPRLTRHVRHRHKYLDVGVAPSLAFRFTDAGGGLLQARSLTELVQALPSVGLDGHLRRSDISRWVQDVVGDRELAGRVRVVEDGYRAGRVADPANALIQAVEDCHGWTPAPLPWKPRP